MHTANLLSGILARKGDLHAPELSAEALRLHEQTPDDHPGWDRRRRGLAMTFRNHGRVLDAVGRSSGGNVRVTARS
jgi:hypothetical protein